MAKRKKKDSRVASPRLISELTDQPEIIIEGALDKIYALLIVALGFWIYWPVLNGGWLWDDDKSITRNALVHDPVGFWKAWIQPDGLGDYYPLTSAVRWLQWQSWGADTLGYHLTNLALHLISAFLLWRLFYRLGLRPAWLGALVFTVHPLMVESVAWITELKNTLSLPPLLLAMLFWLQYDEHKRRSNYLLALVFFIVSMLAKTSGLMLPVIFLGYAWWQRRKLTRDDFKACLPFFLIAFVAGLVTALMPHSYGGEGTIQTGSPEARLASVGWALLCMLGKCILPLGLMPDYPDRLIVTPTPFDLLPWLFLGVGCWFVWSRRMSWGLGVMAGLGFFLLNLAPVLGFILKNYNAMIWSLDHLMYLPIIGLIGLFVAAAGQLQARFSRIIGTAAMTLVVGLLALEAHWYAGAFSDEETLWRYAADRSPHFLFAEENLGRALLLAGRPEEAKPHFEEAVRINPNRGAPHYSLGETLVAMGQPSAGVDEYEQAMKLQPDDNGLEDNFGVALIQLGKFPEAIGHFQQAIRLQPDDALAYNNMGSALALSGRYQEAADSYAKADELSPNSAMTQDNLGDVLLKLGRPDQAREYYEKARALDPNDAKARDALGKLEGKP